MYFKLNNLKKLATQIKPNLKQIFLTLEFISLYSAHAIKIIRLPEYVEETYLNYQGNTYTWHWFLTLLLDLNI